MKLKLKTVGIHRRGGFLWVLIVSKGFQVRFWARLWRKWNLNRQGRELLWIGRKALKMLKFFSILGSQETIEIKVGMQSENNCFIKHTHNKTNYPNEGELWIEWMFINLFIHLANQPTSQLALQQIHIEYFLCYRNFAWSKVLKKITHDVMNSWLSVKSILRANLSLHDVFSVNFLLFISW